MARWNEALHPRDRDGQFGRKGGAGARVADVAKNGTVATAATGRGGGLRGLLKRVAAKKNERHIPGTYRSGFEARAQLRRLFGAEKPNGQRLRKMNPLSLSEPKIGAADGAKTTTPVKHAYMPVSEVGWAKMRRSGAINRSGTRTPQAYISPDHAHNALRGSSGHVVKVSVHPAGSWRAASPIGMYARGPVGFKRGEASPLMKVANTGDTVNLTPMPAAKLTRRMNLAGNLATALVVGAVATEMGVRGHQRGVRRRRVENLQRQATRIPGTLHRG